MLQVQGFITHLFSFVSFQGSRGAAGQEGVAGLDGEEVD